MNIKQITAHERLPIKLENAVTTAAYLNILSSPLTLSQRMLFSLSGSSPNLSSNLSLRRSRLTTSLIF